MCIVFELKRFQSNPPSNLTLYADTIVNILGNGSGSKSGQPKQRNAMCRETDLEIQIF